MRAATTPAKEKKNLKKQCVTLLFGLLGSVLALPAHSQQGAGFSQDPEVRAFILACTNSTALTLPT
jgi:hypothetical protein